MNENVPTSPKRGRPRTRFSQPCQCGCGEQTSPGKRFIRGHHIRISRPPARSSADDAQFLASTYGNCEPTEKGCLVWKGFTLDSGYAICNRNGKCTSRHRAIYEAVHGPVAEDRQIHHTCENRACMNVAHLKPCTTTEHSREHRRLSNEEVAEIRSRKASGVSAKELAAEYGYAVNSMRNIISANRYSDVPRAEIQS